MLLSLDSFIHDNNKNQKTPSDFLFADRTAVQISVHIIKNHDMKCQELKHGPNSYLDIHILKHATCMDTCMHNRIRV